MTFKDAWPVRTLILKQSSW